MTRERDERASAGTRENLIRAALREFAARGYDESSVREICAAAGVTTGALYFFFKNKENLFREAISPVMEPLEDLIRSVGSDRVSKLIIEGRPPEEGLPARARRFLELCEERRDVIDVLKKNRTSAVAEKMRGEHIAALSETIRSFLRTSGAPEMAGDDLVVKWLANIALRSILVVVEQDESPEEALKHLRIVSEFISAGVLSLRR